MPLRDRKTVLARLAEDARRWLALTDGVVGEGRRLFELVVSQDLEGIVAKRVVVLVAAPDALYESCGHATTPSSMASSFLCPVSCTLFGVGKPLRDIGAAVMAGWSNQ